MNTKKYESVDSLIEEMDKQTAKENKTLFGWLKNNIYYPVYRKVDRLIEFFKWDIKSFIQRGIRGWADRDTWGLDYYLADVIEKSTVHLLHNTHGYPSGLSEEEWNKILTQISATFSIAQKVSTNEVVLTETWEDYAKFKKIYANLSVGIMSPDLTKEFYAGFDLFKKYFFNLWD